MIYHLQPYNIEENKVFAKKFITSFSAKANFWGDRVGSWWETYTDFRGRILATEPIDNDI